MNYDHSGHGYQKYRTLALHYIDKKEKSPSQLLDADALQETYALPDTVADFGRQFAPFESLIDEPESDDELLFRESSGAINVD